MKKIAKKQATQHKKYDCAKNYSLSEAVKIVKTVSTTTFDGSVDIAVRLGIDTTKPQQMIRSTVDLPHGTGKIPRVLVICNPDKEDEAKKAGADHVGLDEYLKKIEEGWVDIDTIVTQPMLMVKLGRLGRVLGPVGLMPSIKTGTVTNDIKAVVSSLKSSRVKAIHTDKTGGIVHSSVGRISFAEEKIEANVQSFIDTLRKLKHNAVKGQYIQTVTLSPTMGPGVRVDITTL